MKVTSNAHKIVQRLRSRVSEWDAAVMRGLKRIVTKVDRYQVENLSGSNSAPPGSYPVPNRKGTLMRGHFFEVRSASLALAGNTAAHATVIHKGLGTSSSYGPRKFLSDAADRVDAGAEMALEIPPRASAA